MDSGSFIDPSKEIPEILNIRRSLPCIIRKRKQEGVEPPIEKLQKLECTPEEEEEEAIPSADLLDSTYSSGEDSPVLISGISSVEGHENEASESSDIKIKNETFSCSGLFQLDTNDHEDPQEEEEEDGKKETDGEDLEASGIKKSNKVLIKQENSCFNDSFNTNPCSYYKVELDTKDTKEIKIEEKFGEPCTKEAALSGMEHLLKKKDFRELRKAKDFRGVHSDELTEPLWRSVDGLPIALATSQSVAGGKFTAFQTNTWDATLQNSVKTGVAPNQRRKHQINWLAQEARDKESDLVEMQRISRVNKYQTAMKYGW